MYGIAARWRGAFVHVALERSMCGTASGVGHSMERNSMLRHILSMATVSAFAGSVLAAEPVIDQDQRLLEVEQRLDRLETAQPVSAPAKSAGSFNPDVTLILSGFYEQLANDTADYRIA